MKIYFVNLYKDMKNTTSFWWLMTPSIQKLWNGELINIGTRGLYITLDFRGINTIEDLVNALKYLKKSK